MENTVTLSLELYQQMADEITRLQKENKEKIVYKYYMHPIYGYIMIILIVSILLFIDK